MLPHDDVGEGPPLILLHAGVADRTMWAEHLEPLARAGHRIIAVDLPGFGDASVSTGVSAPWVDVLATMDGLGVERAALAGSSFGGAVALRVALVAPERVSSLALVSAPPHDLEPSAELQEIWTAEEEALERGDVDAAVAAVVGAWTLPGSPPELRERIGRMQRRAFETQFAEPEPDEAPDPAEEEGALEALDVPALVAVGEYDVGDFRSGAERMAQALPRARHHVIAAAGHLAPLEAPEAFRELLLAFLPD